MRCCAAQDNILNSIACHALARMAYIAPDLVLPIMHERFEVSIAYPFCISCSWHVFGASRFIWACGLLLMPTECQLSTTKQLW